MIRSRPKAFCNCNLPDQILRSSPMLNPLFLLIRVPRLSAHIVLQILRLAGSKWTLRNCKEFSNEREGAKWPSICATIPRAEVSQILLGIASGPLIEERLSTILPRAYSKPARCDMLACLLARESELMGTLRAVHVSICPAYEILLLQCSWLETPSKAALALCCVGPGCLYCVLHLHYRWKSLGLPASSLYPPRSSDTDVDELYRVWR